MIAEILQSFLFATVAYGIFAIPSTFLIKEAYISKIGRKKYKL